jgi:hypothetical protein
MYLGDVSELHDREAGYPLEVPMVQGGDRMTEVQRCRADQQVFEGDLDALSFLLSFDASRKSRDVKRHRMHWHVAGQPLDELQSPFLPRRRFRPIGTMNQFGDCDDRHTDFGYRPGSPGRSRGSAGQFGLYVRRR